jgi:K+-transporting ATPase ATPase C chain
MFEEFAPALRLTLVTFVLCGLAYPLGMTAAAQALFPAQANGSLIVMNGRPVGSALVGQRFDGPGWFHGRVSAIGYQAASSGASNLGPTNKALIARVRRDVAGARREDPSLAGPLPVDWLTQSASGLDPHIRSAAARAQAARALRGPGRGPDRPGHRAARLGPVRRAAGQRAAPEPLAARPAQRVPVAASPRPARCRASSGASSRET